MNNISEFRILIPFMDYIEHYKLCINALYLKYFFQFDKHIGDFLQINLLMNEW